MTRGRYNTEQPNVSQIIADLKRRVERLEAGNRAGYTSVDKGSLNVKSGSMTIGQSATFEEGGSPSVAFYRSDGSVAFTVDSPDTHQAWALYDGVGNVVVGDDKTANQGLLRPWMPLVWTTHSNIVPTINTSSGTFTGLQSSVFFKQHPQVYIEVLCYCSDGTTAGELRVMVAGSTQQIGATQTITAGYYGLVYVGPTPVPGRHLGQVELEVQVRRTAGAGTVGVRVWDSYGMESF